MIRGETARLGHKAKVVGVGVVVLLGAIMARGMRMRDIRRKIDIHREQIMRHLTTMVDSIIIISSSRSNRQGPALDSTIGQIHRMMDIILLHDTNIMTMSQGEEEGMEAALLHLIIWYVENENARSKFRAHHSIITHSLTHNCTHPFT